MVLKISQNSQENNCARVSFLIKLLRSATVCKAWKLFLLVKESSSILAVASKNCKQILWKTLPNYYKLIGSADRLIELHKINWCSQRTSSWMFDNVLNLPLRIKTVTLRCSVKIDVLKNFAKLEVLKSLFKMNFSFKYLF